MAIFFQNHRGKPHRPRIVAVVDTFPAVPEAFVYVLLSNMRQAGYEVTVLARRRGEGGAKVPGLDAIRYLPSANRSRLARGVAALTMLARLAVRSPRQVGPALRVLGMAGGGWSAFLRRAYVILPLLLIEAEIVYFAFGGLAARYLEFFRLRPNGFLSLRGSDVQIEPLHNEAYRWRLRQVLPQAAGIHCVCHKVRERAEALAGRGLPRARIIYTALHPAFEGQAARGTGCSEEREPRGPLRIVSVGRLDWKKGLEHGIRAFRALLERGVAAQWQIVGEGPYGPALEWAIRDEGVDHAVQLAGAKDAAGVRAALAAADVFFHPSVSEGVSNAVLEAMALGVPVLATDVGGMREVLGHETHGVLTAPRNWRAMADALEQFARNPRRRERLGERAQQYVWRQFTRERQQSGFAALFEQAVESR